MKRFTPFALLAALCAFQVGCTDEEDLNDEIVEGAAAANDPTMDADDRADAMEDAAEAREEKMEGDYIEGEGLIDGDAIDGDGMDTNLTEDPEDLELGEGVIGAES